MHRQHAATAAMTPSAVVVFMTGLQRHEDTTHPMMQPFVSGSSSKASWQGCM
jgi:hypothetical protein